METVRGWARAWVRFLGLHTERFDVTVPAPPAEVLDRFHRASGDWITDALRRPLLRRLPRRVVRRKVRGGLALWIVHWTAHSANPHLYVRAEPAGDGTRVRAEIRPNRWLQVLGGLGLTLVAVAAVSALLAVGPAFAAGGWNRGRVALGAAALLVAGFHVGRARWGAVGVADRAVLRTWCDEVARADPAA